MQPSSMIRYVGEAGEIEILALSALLNLTEQREISISIVLNIVLLWQVVYHLR
jgi:hypothetical protein